MTTVKALVIKLLEMPLDMEVLGFDSDGILVHGDLNVKRIHAKEDGDGVVREKVQGYGADYVVVL
jgi:hypothetical protein